VREGEILNTKGEGCSGRVGMQIDDYHYCCAYFMCRLRLDPKSSGR
jgi:hypothetical protein